MLGNPQNGYVCNQRAPYGATFKGSKADKCFFGGSMAPCNFSDGKTIYFFHFLVNHRVNLKDRRIRGSPSSHPQVPPLHSKWHGQTKRTAGVSCQGTGHEGNLEFCTSWPFPALTPTHECMDIISHTHTHIWLTCFC